VRQKDEDGKYTVDLPRLRRCDTTVGRGDGLTQYRCRIGHLYSPKSALAVHAKREENTLWSAVVLLEEGGDLAEAVSKQASIKDGEGLKILSVGKRQLASLVKDVLSKFGELSLALE
jgi:hypothetical protein